MNSRTTPQNCPAYSSGLTDQDVYLRIEKGLVNGTVDKATKKYGQIFRENIFTLFNAFHFVIAFCLCMVNARANLAFLITVLSNIGIGIGQEIHAKRMVENLSLIRQVMVTVIRNGSERKIAMDELVLDDLMILSSGCQVCADAVVIGGEAEVNESLLTGEADPVFKAQGDLLLSVSFICSGKCLARVEHVGMDNYAAKLTQEARKYKRPNSEILRSVRKATKSTSFLIFPIGILLFLEAFYLRSDSVEHATISISAALLGMLPKGLVLLTSTSLVVGIIKLSRKKILVQELHAIETLARVDMLCLDKTGTLTEGKMSVSSVHSFDSEMPISTERAIQCFVGAMDDNNATFFALKERFEADKTYQPTRKTSFSSERKWSGVTFDQIGSILLGAPEVICPSGGYPIAVSEALKLGKRTLLLGYSMDSIDEGMPRCEPVAAIIFDDPIRKSAKKTLDFFRREGVAIKLISGDNPVTVSDVARQAGLESYENYVDVTGMDAEDLEKAAHQYMIFGRVLPDQKKQLIQALQKKGHTVAMTGDGVNDVSALKEADCSIAMAAGSDAVKQVSQLVLLNSDFTVLLDAVMEGRRVINNITRFGGVFVVKTIFSILLSLFSILTLSAFPFAPVQISLYDFLVEGFPSFVLSFEPCRKRVSGAFLQSVIQRALPFGIIILIDAVIVWAASAAIGLPMEEARAVLYYCTGFAGLLSLLRACLPFNRLRLWVCAAMIIGFFVAVLLFGGILELAALGASSIGLFAGISVLSIPLAWLLTIRIKQRV